MAYDEKAPDFGVEIIIRLPDVMRLTGRSKQAVYDDIHARTFTRPVAIGGRAVGWPAREVAAINRARIAGLRVLELQALVDELHAQRKAPPSEKPGGARRKRGR